MATAAQLRLPEGNQAIVDLDPVWLGSAVYDLTGTTLTAYIKPTPETPDDDPSTYVITATSGPNGVITILDAPGGQATLTISGTVIPVPGTLWWHLDATDGSGATGTIAFGPVYVEAAGYADGVPAGSGPGAGTAGPRGPAGATGPAGLNWRGAWSGTTAYAVTDAVSYGGSSYVAIAAGTGHEPDTSPSQWSLPPGWRDGQAAGRYILVPVASCRGPCPQGFSRRAQRVPGSRHVRRHGIPGKVAWRDGEVWLEPAATALRWPPPDPASNWQWAFNQALRELGVDRDEGFDEFDAVNLGKHRHTEDWRSAG